MSVPDTPMHVREKAIRAYLQTGSLKIAAGVGKVSTTSVYRWLSDPRMQPVLDRLHRETAHQSRAALDAYLTKALKVGLGTLDHPELVSARDAAVVIGIAVDKLEQITKSMQDLPQSDHLDYFDPDKLDELRAQIWEGLTEQRRRLLLDKQARAVDAQLVPDPVQVDAVPAQTSPAIIPITLTSSNAIPAESSPYTGLPEPDQD